MWVHYVGCYTVVSVWFYFVIPTKNVKNVINRFYRGELKTGSLFVRFVRIVRNVVAVRNVLILK